MGTPPMGPLLTSHQVSHAIACSLALITIFPPTRLESWFATLGYCVPEVTSLLTSMLTSTLPTLATHDGALAFHHPNVIARVSASALPEGAKACLRSGWQVTNLNTNETFIDLSGEWCRTVQQRAIEQDEWAAAVVDGLSCDAVCGTNPYW